MVFQSYSLNPRMTVEENLSFGLRIAGTPKDEIAARVGRAAKMLHLEPMLKRKPAEMSGGQRQRVAIGRALVRNCDVFLFDEPLSNLDAKLRTELRVEIKKLHHETTSTTIYVTHDQVEALTLADRIAVMKSGMIQQFASPRDIYHKPANMFVARFIGSPAMNMVDGTLESGAGGALFRCQDGAVDAVRAYLVSRYGDFILLKPPFKPEALLLWPGPTLVHGLWRRWRAFRPASRARHDAALERGGGSAAQGADQRR
jgi:multiple sugar transport system ATP-binding protein